MHQVLGGEISLLPCNCGFHDICMINYPYFLHECPHCLYEVYREAPPYDEFGVDALQCACCGMFISLTDVQAKQIKWHDKCESVFHIECFAPFYNEFETCPGCDKHVNESDIATFPPNGDEQSSPIDAELNLTLAGLAIAEDVSNLSNFADFLNNV